MAELAPVREAGGIEFFSGRFGIDGAACEGLLGHALEWGGDYADLFFEYNRQRLLTVEDGRVRQATSGIVQGLGVRVVRGEAVGYASTERFDAASMREAARTAANIAKHGGGAEPTISPLRRVSQSNLYPVETFSLDEPPATAVDLLLRGDAAARAVAPSISHVETWLVEYVREVVVATSEGRFAGDTQPMVRYVVTASSTRGADRQRSYAGRSARAGLDVFATDGRTPEAIGRQSAERAVLLHDAVEAPAGFLPVVLAAGESGVFLHEAVGHGLEADFNRMKLSTFTGRIGDRVASPLCTVVDDGTIPGLQGGLNIDDEGQETRRNVLIENGVLRGYLHDWISARHYGVPPSGSARRQDFRSVPMPRMMTTYLMPGESTPEEIVGAVDRGIYCRSFSGGQVDIASGDYVFSTEEAYLIEGGRITAPIRTVNLIGNGPDSLTRVTMVGNDLAFDETPGMCGKNGQAVPTSDGLPTILVDGITVGGTRT